MNLCKQEISAQEIFLVTIGYRELPQVTGNVKVNWNTQPRAKFPKSMVN